MSLRILFLLLVASGPVWAQTPIVNWISETNNPNTIFAPARNGFYQVYNPVFPSTISKFNSDYKQITEKPLRIKIGGDTAADLHLVSVHNSLWTIHHHLNKKENIQEHYVVKVADDLSIEQPLLVDTCPFNIGAPQAANLDYTGFKVSPNQRSFLIASTTRLYYDGSNNEEMKVTVLDENLKPKWSRYIHSTENDNEVHFVQFEVTDTGTVLALAGYGDLKQPQHWIYKVHVITAEADNAFSFDPAVNREFLDRRLFLTKNGDAFLLGTHKIPGTKQPAGIFSFQINYTQDNLSGLVDHTFSAAVKDTLPVKGFAKPQNVTYPISYVGEFANGNLVMIISSNFETNLGPQTGTNLSNKSAVVKGCEEKLVLMFDAFLSKTTEIVVSDELPNLTQRASFFTFASTFKDQLLIGYGYEGFGQKSIGMATSEIYKLAAVKQSGELKFLDIGQNSSLKNGQTGKLNENHFAIYSIESSGKYKHGLVQVPE